MHVAAKTTNRYTHTCETTTVTTIIITSIIIKLFEALKLVRIIINPRRACAERVTVVVSCVCVCVCVSVCLNVCLSEHTILAVRAIRSIFLRTYARKRKVQPIRWLHLMTYWTAEYAFG